MLQMKKFLILVALFQLIFLNAETIDEVTVIGSNLVSNDIFEEKNTINSSTNIYDPMHQKIFEAVESLIYKGLLANPITLKNYFEDEKDELNVPEYLVKIMLPHWS